MNSVHIASLDLNLLRVFDALMRERSADLLAVRVLFVIADPALDCRSQLTLTRHMHHAAQPAPHP